MLQPVLRVAAGLLEAPQEALHQWAAEEAWVGAPPLGAVDPVAGVGLVLGGQPSVQLGEVPRRA